MRRRCCPRNWRDWGVSDRSRTARPATSVARRERCGLLRPDRGSVPSRFPDAIRTPPPGELHQRVDRTRHSGHPLSPPQLEGSMSQSPVSSQSWRRAPTTMLEEDSPSLTSTKQARPRSPDRTRLPSPPGNHRHPFDSWPPRPPSRVSNRVVNPSAHVPTAHAYAHVYAHQRPTPTATPTWAFRGGVAPQETRLRSSSALRWAPPAASFAASSSAHTGGRERVWAVSTPRRQEV
jgi:hypothetical protein